MTEIKRVSSNLSFISMSLAFKLIIKYTLIQGVNTITYRLEKKQVIVTIIKLLNELDRCSHHKIWNKLDRV